MTSTDSQTLTDDTCSSNGSTTPTGTPTEKARRPSYTSKAPAPLTLVDDPPAPAPGLVLNSRAAALKSHNCTNNDVFTSPTADDEWRAQLGIESPTELRVQVDRKLLERLLLVSDRGQPGEPTDAEQFFTKVMKSTKTIISWPSRLKIGAKTKKDPYVKILGTPNQVVEARDMVLATLKTRQNRLDLKIDVPFTDHSHIIGRQGKNTQRVMKETGCHIHFPDSNKNRENEKSNQVTIAGNMHAVETARRAIRSLAPLAIQFSLHSLLPHVNVQSLLAVSGMDEKLGFPGLSVAMRVNRANNQPYCLVRGAVNDEQRIRDCIQKIKQLYFVPNAAIVYQISMEIMPAQQTEIRCLIQMLTNLTQATIRSPSADDVKRGATTFVIHGTLDAVLCARCYLIALLPCQLQFSVRADRGSECLDMAQIEVENNVRATIKQRNVSDGQFHCTLIAPEYRIGDLYGVRERVCGLNDPLPLVTDYQFITDTVHANITQAQKEARQRAAIMAANTLSLMPPPTYIPPHQRMPALIPTSNAMAYQQMGQNCYMPSTMNMEYSNQAVYGQPAYNNVNINQALLDKVNQMTERARQTELMTMSSYRSTPEGYVVSMLARDSLQHGTPPMSSLAVTSESVLSSSPTAQATALAALNLIDAVRQQECQQFNKAPGHERFIDYEAKRLMAELAKAAQPKGARAPSGEFTGYLFSNSMPQQMMSDRLRSSRTHEGHTEVRRKLSDKATPTPPSTPLDGKAPMGLPSTGARNSHVMQATVPEHSEVHHTRPDDQIFSGSNSPPTADAPRSVFAQSSAMETMRPLFNGANVQSTQWQAHAAMPIVDGGGDPLQHLTLRAVLAEIGLEKLYPKFEENEVDLEALLCMNEGDFETLGASLGARAKLRALQNRLNTLRQWSQQSGQ